MSIRILILLLLATVAHARVDTVPESSRIRFTVGDNLNQPPVVERACPNFIMNYEQAGEDRGLLFGCKTQMSEVCELIYHAELPTAPAGVRATIAYPWFRWFVSNADGVGESTLTIQCSYIDVMTDAGLPPRPVGGFPYIFSATTGGFGLG